MRDLAALRGENPRDQAVFVIGGKSATEKNGSADIDVGWKSAAPSTTRRLGRMVEDATLFHPTTALTPA
jgi:hypothetical protein